MKERQVWKNIGQYRCAADMLTDTCRFSEKKKKFSSEISTGGYTIFLIEVEAKGHCNDLKCLAFVLILHKCFLHNC